jgi:hypothetical protein
MERWERLRTQSRLQQAGVPALEADRLIEATLSDPLLVLAIVPLPEGARVGDSVTAPGAASERKTLRIEALARGSDGKAAVVALPVTGSGDAQVTAPVRRRV